MMMSKSIVTLSLLVCAMLTGSAVAQTVTINSPTNNSTVSSPVTVNATFSNGGTAQYMKLWVDGVAQYYNNGQDMLTYPVSLGAGRHQIVVQAYKGNLYSATTNVVVQSAPSPAVTITGPTANATGASPVTANATL